MTESPTNLFSLIKYGTDYLKQHQIKNSKKEIEWFCKLCFQLPLYKLKSDYNIHLTKQEQKIFKNFLQRRSKQEPFQYIINTAPFYNKDFFVNESVLIPRPETETMIEKLKGKKFQAGLDIGTGCGNLAIILRQEKIVENMTATDTSKEALKIAKKNAKNLNIDKIFFHHHDILKDKFLKKYNLIVSNPPYISQEEYNTLPKHIKKFEPKNALTDGMDGYMFYKFFANNLQKLLKPHGTIMIEIGFACTKPYIEALFKNRYKILWHKDLNSDYRILQLNV